MKLIIDIPEKVVTAIQNGEDYRYDIHTAIAQGIHYEERPQGDLISREALKHRFAQITYVRFTADMGQGGFEMFSEKEIEGIIDKAPTVTDRTEEVLSLQNTIAKLVDGIAKTDRPQGEWKVYGRQGGIPITDYCTNCKYEMKWYKTKYNFCPNCGAKMKGGAE